MESKILVKRREISFDHFSLRLPTYLMTIFPILAKGRERIDSQGEIFCGKEIRSTKDSILLNEKL